MIKTTVSSATAALLVCSACFAQPPGITREMIESALPVEGAPLAVAGPYETMSEPAFGAPGLMVFRPKNLDAFPARDTLPVMAWGNGGCAPHTPRHPGVSSSRTPPPFLFLRAASPQ